jgi:hypothetical protein
MTYSINENWMFHHDFSFLINNPNYIIHGYYYYETILSLLFILYSAYDSVKIKLKSLDSIK